MVNGIKMKLHLIYSSLFVFQLFEMLSNDIPSKEVPALMSEFLTGILKNN